MRFWKRRGQAISSLDDLLKNRMLQGYNGERWFGDSSTYYTIGGRAEKFQIPQRIAQTNPATRFIYIMRDPVERIISHYHHLLNGSNPPDTFDAFLQSTEGHISFRTSMYHLQLRSYLKHFPRKHFLLLKFEQLRDNTKYAVSQAFDFLDCPGTDFPMDFKTYNASVKKSIRSDQHQLMQSIQAAPGFKDLKKDKLKLEDHFGISWPQALL